MQTLCNTYWDAGKGNLTAQNTRKPFGGPGSAAYPAGRAYSAPASPLSGGERLAAPPQEPHPPLLALRASPLLHYSKISSDAVDDIRPHVQRRRPVVKSGGRRQSDQAIKLFQSASEIGFAFHFWHKSFILHVVALAELSNNGFEWKKNVTFWGSRHAPTHPTYFHWVRTPPTSMIYTSAHVAPYRIRNHSIHETHRRSKIPTRAPWVRSLVHGVGKFVTFDRNHCISRKQYEISMDSHTIDLYSEIIAGRWIHQFR